MSKSTRSGSSETANSTAFCPSWAERTRYPLAFRLVVIAQIYLGSSSTTRIRTISLFIKFTALDLAILFKVIQSVQLGESGKKYYLLQAGFPPKSALRGLQ